MHLQRDTLLVCRTGTTIVQWTKLVALSSSLLHTRKTRLVLERVGTGTRVRETLLCSLQPYPWECCRTQSLLLLYVDWMLSVHCTRYLFGNNTVDDSQTPTNNDIIRVGFDCLCITTPLRLRILVQVVFRYRKYNGSRIRKTIHNREEWVGPYINKLGSKLFIKNTELTNGTRKVWRSCILISNLCFYVIDGTPRVVDLLFYL